jgi:hypothetical protein
MSTTLGFKAGLDLPAWRPLANAPGSPGSGTALCTDLRNTEDRIPIIYYLQGANSFYSYYPKSDAWMTYGNPALTPAVNSGGFAIFAPAAGPRGTITTGATTTSVVLSTALPASVGVNALANRGDGVGYKLRIVDNASGASGKIAEVYITGNTSGTTPTIYWTGAIGFVPTSGSTYEFLSGRVFLLTAGILAAGSFKYYDIMTNSYSGSLSITNLPATMNTGSATVLLDELYTPLAQLPGAGFLGQLVATGSSPTSITGTVAGADAAVLSNEYRNFQIRIVQDTGTPTSVGQRRVVTSHTAGTSPVYTVPTWTVTPSSTATFVIENANWLLLWTTGGSTTYVYNPTQTAITGGGAAAAGLATNTWSSTLFTAGNSSGSNGASAWQPFGMSLDANKNVRFSHIYMFQGASTATLNLYDIAGAANGLASAATFGGASIAWNTGSWGAYESAGVNNGRYTYFNQSGTQLYYRFDNLNRTMEPWSWLPYPQGAAAEGYKGVVYQYFDTTTSIGTLIAQRSSNLELFGVLNQR